MADDTVTQNGQLLDLEAEQLALSEQAELYDLKIDVLLPLGAVKLTRIHKSLQLVGDYNAVTYIPISGLLKVAGYVLTETADVQQPVQRPKLHRV